MTRIKCLTSAGYGEPDEECIVARVMRIYLEDRDIDPEIVAAMIREHCDEHQARDPGAMADGELLAVLDNVPGALG